MIRAIKSFSSAATTASQPLVKSTLEVILKNDLKAAMKVKDQIKSQTLKSVLAEIGYAQKRATKPAVDDNDLYIVLHKMITKRQDSIGQFMNAGREDLVESERKQMDIIKSYLPTQMSEEEIGVLLKEIILRVGASSMKDLGSVMKEARSVFDPVKAPPVIVRKVASSILNDKL